VVPVVVVFEGPADVVIASGPRAMLREARRVVEVARGMASRCKIKPLSLSPPYSIEL
jgi:hypothetical protein